MKLIDYVDYNDEFFDYELVDKLTKYVDKDKTIDITHKILELDIYESFIYDLLEEFKNVNCCETKRDIKILVTLRDRENNQDINKQRNCSYCWRWAHKIIDNKWIPYDYALKISLCRRKKKTKEFKCCPNPYEANYKETYELWFSINKELFDILRSYYPELYNLNQYFFV